MSGSQQGRGGKSMQRPYRTPDDFDREAIKKEIFEGVTTCSDEKAALYRRLHQSNYNNLSVMPARDLRKYDRYENLFRSETVLAALKEREKLLQSSLENPQNYIEPTNSNEVNDKETTDPTPKKQKKKKKKHKSVQVQTEKTTGSSGSHTNNQNTSPAVSNLVTTATLPEKKNHSKLTDIPTKEDLPSIVRTIKVLIRGIPVETNTDEIALELKKKGLEIYKIIQFSKREDNTYKSLPLFLVLLPSLSHYKEICTLKFYKQYPINVEKFRGSRELLQCFRCQGFNHSPRTCTAPPRCLKCAGEHFSYKCTNSRDTPAKCCNCQQNHTSNFSGCAARPRRKEAKSNHVHRDISLIVRRVIDEIKAFKIA